MEFTSTVAGIPCVINVYDFGYAPIPGADSDWDAEGQEPQWQVCDRRGRHAPWLEAKLTDKDIARIKRELETNAQEYAL